MQVLCGLQGIFLLFNCQTPETFMIPAKLGKYKITPLENETETFLGIIQAYIR